MRPSGGFVTNCWDSDMSRRSAIVDTGRTDGEEDEEGGDEGEEEDGGAGDTAEAVVVAVLTLGRTYAGKSTPFGLRRLRDRCRLLIRVVVLYTCTVGCWCDSDSVQRIGMKFSGFRVLNFQV